MAFYVLYLDFICKGQGEYPCVTPPSLPSLTSPPPPRRHGFVCEIFPSFEIDFGLLENFAFIQNKVFLACSVLCSSFLLFSMAF